MVDLVRDLGEPVQELVGLDLEDRLERRELLEHPPPLVDSPHAFHEQSLRARLDGLLGGLHGAELEVELTLVPHQESVDRAIALQVAALRVDQAPVEEVDRTAAVTVGELEHTGLPADVDRLEQVDQTHLRKRAAEAGLGEAPPLQAPTLVTLEHQVHARDDLFDVDRLGEVVLDAQLEAADLALHRAVARQEDERDLGVLRALTELLDEAEAIELRQSSVAEDQVRLAELDHLEGRLRILAARDRVPGLAQTDLQHPQASRVGIDEEEVLLRHVGSVSGSSGWRRCTGTPPSLRSLGHGVGRARRDVPYRSASEVWWSADPSVKQSRRGLGSVP